MSRTDVSAWLRIETPKALGMLTELRERLATSLEKHSAKTPEDPPSREWCRAFERYQAGYHTMLNEERERLKLLMLAQRGGQQPLSDDEYEREMRQMGIDAVRGLDEAAFAAEIERRGLGRRLKAVPDDSD